LEISRHQRFVLVEAVSTKGLNVECDSFDDGGAQSAFTLTTLFQVLKELEDGLTSFVNNGEGVCYVRCG
jgi:hypothetical protein